MNKDIFRRRQDIILGISKASLEEVTEILNYYKSSQRLEYGYVNMVPIVIDNVPYQFKYNPKEAATINARYKELTGHDHPKFLVEQKKVLDLLLANENELKKQGYFSSQIDVLKCLRDSLEQGEDKVEIACGLEKHILSRFTEIIMNLDEASLEDIESLLNYYNSKAIIIDGVAYQPFNDPMSATKLNEKYRKLTGHDHPVYIKQTPIVIDELLSSKENLINAGVCSSTYFDSLEQLKDMVCLPTNEDIKQK